MIIIEIKNNCIISQTVFITLSVNHEHEKRIYEQGHLDMCDGCGYY